MFLCFMVIVEEEERSVWKSKNKCCCDVKGCTLGYNVLAPSFNQTKKKSNIFSFELDLVLSPFITLVPSNKEEKPDIWINLFRLQNNPLYNSDEN